MNAPLFRPLTKRPKPPWKCRCGGLCCRRRSEERRVGKERRKRRRHTRWNCDWSSDVCSSDLPDGVTFQSHIDGSRHRLTPAVCMDLQRQFDSTITMALDECTPFPATYEEAEASMEMSMRWALLSKEIGRASCRERA